MALQSNESSLGVDEEAATSNLKSEAAGALKRQP